MSKFKVGDKVRKITGYPFNGVVCATYDTEEKCCVKHKDKWEHIFSDKQLVYDHPEYQYLDLVQDCIDNGSYREGRNGGTYSLFGRQMRFNLAEGFPLLTTKKVHFKSIVVELLWFLRGDTNVKYLHDHGVTIWDEWADENGDLGPVYGAQWRNWNGVDQIYNVVQSLINDPYGRRHVVSAWNPDDIPNMALPPCHCLFQFYVDNGKLSCQLYMRSNDLGLGAPFNIASYALLTHLIANEVGLDVGNLIYTVGDLHLYQNHIDNIKDQLERIPYKFPEIEWNKTKSIFDLEYEDFRLINYQYHPHIKLEVSS